jgi:predicted ABC-type ATPase
MGLPKDFLLFNRRLWLLKPEDFAFETTLSTKSYQPLIVKAKAEGYKVVMIYFWLESVELAKERVKDRVKKGVITFRKKW